MLSTTTSVVTVDAIRERMQIPVTIYRGTKNPSVKRNITLSDLFDEIKNDDTDYVQSSKELYHFYKVNKTQYASLKEKLTGFSIGQFSKRTDKDIEIYIPLLVFDVDGIENEMDTDFKLNECKSCPYIYAAFPSISGHGLRIFVWTRAQVETHKQVYQETVLMLSEYLNLSTDKELKIQYKGEGMTNDEIRVALKESPHIDTSTSNVSRLWFYAHVPEISFYLNEESEVFENKKPSPTAPAIVKLIPSSSKIDANDLELDTPLKISICKKMLSQRAIAGGRNNYVYTLAKMLYEHGVSEAEVIAECMTYEEEDFQKDEIQRTVRSALKTATYQMYSNQQLSNYLNIGKNSTGKSNTRITDNKTAATITKEETLDKPKKKNKFMQIKTHLATKYDFRLNEISIEIEYKLKEENQYKILNENNLLIEFLEAGYNSVESYLMALLKSNFVPRYNPFEEYFFSLPDWNDTQEDHITKLATYVHALDQEWFNLQFKKMLVRTVACALNVIPFNKHCFTLLGRQNDGKTSFLRFLCPPDLDDYIKENLDIHNKDGRISLCQNIFINLDELANFSKYDINRTKAFFTIDKVKERLPYDRKASNHLRRASFLASTNSDEFLTDETGNVRWLVFEIDGVLHDHGGKDGYNRNVDVNLVWSQAYSLLRSGFDFKLSPSELSKSEINNKNYQVITIEQELIQSFFEPAVEKDENNMDVFFMTSTEILTQLESKTTSRLSIKNIGKALKLLNYQKLTKRVTESNGVKFLKPQPRKGYYMRSLLR